MNARTILRWTSVAAFCGSILMPPACAQQPPRTPERPPGPTVEVLDGVKLTLLDGWHPSAREYRNAVELVTPNPETSRGVPEARILVTHERRRSHEEALLRLRQILQEIPVQTRLEVRYLEIGGWPAVQRRYQAPIALRGQKEEEMEPPPSALEARVSLRVTTAIAAGELLLRLDGELAPDADPRLADQIEAISASATFPSRGEPDAVEKELRSLEAQGPVSRLDALRPPAGTDLAAEARPILPGVRRPPMAAGGPGAAVGAPLSVQTGVGELEVAVSADGQNVVIGANSGYSFSNDGGMTYAFGGGTPALFPRDGDPSLAWGQSGAFYYGFIGFPNGTPAANNVSGCSTGISVSTDNGATFNFQNHAVLCPLMGAGLCFPDQEHIAADRINAGAGGDQVYSVWRSFTPAGMPPSCSQIGSGFVTPSIVCSQDGAANWTAPAAIGAGDFPRLTVAPDGTVNVAYLQGGNVMLHRFSSCATGLAPQVGFPVVVSAVTSVTCPVPGLDRCNNGNTLASPTVAVDDTSSNHLYVAFATNTGAGNENVVVRDSLDGGATWPGTAILNPAATGRRFMPWVCSVGGQAFATWYDRRVATPAANDNTTFFVGSASVQGGVLQPGVEADLAINPDPQCASGWPCRARSTGDSESCSVQPQLAGRCQPMGGGGSNTPCDHSSTVCPAGESCMTGSGCPKYGDYNGIACASGRVYTAWSSATAPPGLPPAAGLTIYSSVLAASDFYVRDWTDSAVSGDDGAEPSTHPAFYVTSDVWNRRGTAPGPFVDDQPQNEDAGNGAGSIGDNWAFARIRRNAAPLSGSSAVTAHFLVSKLGTGSNYVDAGSADPDVVFLDPDPTVSFAAGALGPTITTAYHWHLSPVVSTHLCLAVEIASVGDPYEPPSLVGSAPGWPATDMRVLADNNKAQRNMGLSTTPATGAGGGFSSYAIAHNAATFRRDMEIRFEVPESAADRVRGLRVGVVGGRQEQGEAKGRLVLEGMEPGENRWIAVTLEAPEGREGEVLPVLFTEVVDGTPVNGFGLGARLGSTEEVIRGALERHRSVFTRLAAGFQVRAGWQQADLALELLRSERAEEAAYRALLKEAVPEVVQASEELLRLDGESKVADPFAFAEATRALEASLAGRDTGAVALAHLTLLNRLDADLTRRQLDQGDPADILQTVRWQEALFADRLPRVRELGKLGCTAHLLRASREFSEGYQRREVGNDDYPALVKGLLFCLRDAVGAAGRKAGRDLAARVEAVERALGSPAALQKAHRELLLGFEALAR